MSVPGYTPKYDVNRPYYFSQMTQTYLTYYVHRRVPPNNLDVLKFIATERYVRRPELLAVDLYGDVEKFWVIPVRNGLQDPVFDMVMGLGLWVPDPSFVRTL